ANSFFTSTGVNEQAVQGQPFFAEDTFVYRVGDGTTNLIAQSPNPNAGTAAIGSTIYVDEYTPSGTLLQSIILPSADSSGLFILSATDTCTSTADIATIRTAVPHNFTPGQQVMISGVLNAGYNGSFTIAALPSISTATESGTTVTITTSTPHGLYVG